RPALTAPADRERSATRRHSDLGVEQAAPDARDDCRTGSGSAREGFARTALPDAQPDVSAIDDLHEPCIDAPREARVALDARTEGGDRRRVDVGDDLHRVRIAH